MASDFDEFPATTGVYKQRWEVIYILKGHSKIIRRKCHTSTGFAIGEMTLHPNEKGKMITGQLQHHGLIFIRLETIEAATPTWSGLVHNLLYTYLHKTARSASDQKKRKTSSVSSSSTSSRTSSASVRVELTIRRIVGGYVEQLSLLH